MFEPYDYQIDCLERIDAARAAGQKKGLVVMASGLGKTVTMALDIHKWRTNRTGRSGRFMFLCDQNEILYQGKTTIGSVLGEGAKLGYFNGQEKKTHGMDGVFASFQTMGRHLNSFDPTEFPYIVVDESHHSQAPTIRSVIDYFKPEWLGGVTATPDRMDGLDIREIYGAELFYLPLEVAMAQGLLTPVEYRLFPDGLPMQDMLGTIAKYAAEFIEPRVIIFTSSLDKCDEVCGLIPGSLAIHSRVPIRERNIRIELFRQGLVHTAVTVDCFNEGVDIPQANVVVFLRSTESPNIFFQQLGRGLRRSEGKDKVVALDFVANAERVKVVQGLWKRIDKERESPVVRDTPRWHRKVSAEASNEVKEDNPNKLHVAEQVVHMLELLESVRPKYVSEIPRLAREYSDKNEFPADRVYARTAALLWWKCKTCDYEWQAAGKRRLQGSKCPACTGKVATADNNLVVSYPELAKEYSPKNDIPAIQVTPLSVQPFVWQCTDPTCGYEWIESATSRVKRHVAGHGCPECYERSSLNELSIEHPTVFAEYSEKNTLPSKVPWWRCDTCGYEWKGSLELRKHGRGCPVCSGKIVTDKTRLDLVYPTLALELVNPNLAKRISINSSKTRLWRCPYCSKQWWASVKARVEDHSCPRCHNPPKEGDSPEGLMVADHPLLSKEYSGRNVTPPRLIQQESTKDCWWTCSSCSFSFAASPHERLHEEVGCPVCTAVNLPASESSSAA